MKSGGGIAVRPRNKAINSDEPGRPIEYGGARFTGDPVQIIFEFYRQPIRPAGFRPPRPRGPPGCPCG